ncbi:hypothetical protein K469DRAFT_577795 [Zopfia rhizophila CBS 207.26]|uniref:Rhodopsin domain-containing protein n=1 Tax=Zopfia rhizophila CBS 207.26 TaxID=1314779 RepID=A0A6A6E373_9PEZI|nr:hypothetical protein K469DRAFT_577795 [Zopfia rhizophila CBS 207.26]
MSTSYSEAYLNANKGPQVLAIIITFPILATITVFLRLYTRFRIVNNPFYDDFAILLALVFAIATSICQGFQVYNGMGRHIQSLTMEQGIGSLKALFASIMMYNFGLTFTKVSIVLQFLRITVDPRVRLSCWALMALTVANSIQTFLTGIWTCNPVPKFWDDRIPGTCVNKPALWYANAAINICQDIWLIVLPIFILKKLVLPRREKVSLVLILGLGGFASLASILRLHALYIVSISQDITWDNPGTATWSSMELNIGIICASLPTLRAFLAKLFPNTFRSTISRNREGYRNSGPPGGVVDDHFGIDQSYGDIVIQTDFDVEHGKNSHNHNSPTTTASEPEMSQPETAQRVW